MPEFCHLHCHTQYSLLDGAAPIKRLIQKASDLEMPAIAITDHGNLYGVPEFYTTARKNNIQPIIGCEFYLTPAGMADKSNRIRYHQVLLAKNEEGYKNLIKLSSLSYSDGYYYKPRIDRETLRQYSNGLVATTCCLQGEVLQAILKKSEEEAKLVFEDYLDIFGEDYYIEIQDHNIHDQHVCNEVLLRWSKEYNVPIIATNDVHYVEESDSEAQDILLCLQTNKDYHDPNRMRFENNQFYLKTTSEMQAAYSQLDQYQIDQALDNTRQIAQKCNLELQMGKLLMPHFPLPAEFNNDMDAFLRHLVYDRAPSRYGELSLVVTERLDYELRIIKQMGYAGYFLIVQDFTTAARTLGVSVGPGRGSAAGSAIAYCLGITNIDPLRYNLLFERFLNPERVSMPDIDIDFDDRGRAKVIDYVVKKYGRESVCQIVTFGTMGARSVIRDVSRVLSIPLSEADRIAKLIPEGPKSNLSSAMKDVEEFRDLLKSPDHDIRKMMEYAQVLEGSARHTGVHAAGVIIAPGNVSDYVPTSVSRGKAGAEDVVTTQYDGKWVEDFGLLKMDFLGLKTLTIIADAIKMIEENHGVKIDPDEIPLDDEATYRLFQKGDIIAVFQFESSGMREWMRKLKPTSIDDLIAMNALYRPGPMDLIPSYIDRKHGREEVVYPHELLKDVLEPTFGLPIYQEQVMQMAQVMGGYTLGGADILRRAMGKKKLSEMVKQREIFVSGAGNLDVPEKIANECFDMMEKFAGYGFNKSHSAAYSVVAYQTAWLKTHYRAEFMAAVLTSEMRDSKKLAIALEEVRHSGLELLPPAVNRSGAAFTVVNGNIQFGLGAIKGVGSSAIEAIVEARKEEGDFSTLYSFCKRVDLKAVNKRTLEGLIGAGALDDLSGHRAQQVAGLEETVRSAVKAKADEAIGQGSLFGGDSPNAVSNFEPSLPTVPEWNRGQVLKQERDLIGFYISGHPLDVFKSEVNAFSTASFGNCDHIQDKTDVSMCGIVTAINKKITRQGRMMAFITIEDFSGQGEIICFSRQYDKFRSFLEVDQMIMVSGEAEVKGAGMRIKAQKIIPMSRVRDEFIRSIVLKIDAGRVDPEEMTELRELCERNRGECKLYFDIVSDKLPKTVRLRSRAYVVDPSPDLMQGLQKLFGPDQIKLEGAGA